MFDRGAVGISSVWESLQALRPFAKGPAAERKSRCSRLSWTVGEKIPLSVISHGPVERCQHARGGVSFALCSIIDESEPVFQPVFFISFAFPGFFA